MGTRPFKNLFYSIKTKKIVKIKLKKFKELKKSKEVK